MEITDNQISKIRVKRGAPCGATWDAVKNVVGKKFDEAPIKIGLDVQFFCTADPAGWDPIYGKSPVHLAAELHRAALITALKKKGV